MTVPRRPGVLIAGIDEAGRGPLAGPVVAAAVILDPAHPVDGLRDSKLLSPQRRERLAVEIRARALAWAVAECSVAEIDDAQHPAGDAARDAPRRRRRLQIVPSQALDRRRPVSGARPCPARAIVKGDRDVAVIAAASILAKTARDAMLVELDHEYPHVRLRPAQGLRHARAPCRARPARTLSRASAQLRAGGAGLFRILRKRAPALAATGASDVSTRSNRLTAAESATTIRSPCAGRPAGCIPRSKR